MTGQELLEQAKDRVAEDGQMLSVRRTAPGGAITTRTVGFIPQAMQHGGDPLNPEGGLAIGDPNLHDFRTPGDSDVKQKDVILAYDGSDWRVDNITGNPIQGVRPWLHCYSTRE